MDDEKELSKEDETPSQWIPKLKKGPKPRLVTIHNRTSLNLERIYFSEQKGSWRRKPPLRIRQKSTEQFGVEGKNGTEGTANYVIEGVESPIEFSWGGGDTPTVSVNVPTELAAAMRVNTNESKLSSKFCEAVFEITEDMTEMLKLLGNLPKGRSKTEGSATVVRPMMMQAQPQSPNRTSTSNLLPTHGGYLMKKGAVRKNWKKRYFWLDGRGTMCYFKSKEVFEKLRSSGKDMKKNALGTFEVAGKDCGPARAANLQYKFSFQVITKERVYLMYTADFMELDQWKDKMISNGAKWEVKLERISRIMDDGSVEFQHDDDVAMPANPLSRVPKNLNRSLDSDDDEPSDAKRESKVEPKPQITTDSNGYRSPPPAVPFLGTKDDSDSDDENEEEKRKRQLLQGIKFKPKTEVKEVDAATLTTFAKSLQLGTPTSSPTRKPKSNPTSPSAQPVQPPVVQQPVEPTPKISIDEVNERSRILLRDAFAKLESGAFAESMSHITQIFQLFSMLENPQLKQKEAKICAFYKYALTILVATKREGITPDELGWITRFLAELPLQPNHRIVCIRMGIKYAIELKNYGFAARMLQLIASNAKLTDRDAANMEMCKSNEYKDAASYPCRKCGTTNPIGNTQCSSCQTAIFLCYHWISANYYRCNYCEAVITNVIGDEDKRCPVCTIGSLVDA